MVRTNILASAKKKSEAIKASAESLGLEEKARLIASELGMKTVYPPYYPEERLYTKESYVEKAAPCSGLTLEIISWTEENLSEKKGKKETVIYVRKPLPLLGPLYRSVLVYASQTPIDEPEKTKVSVFKDQGKWLDDFEMLYVRALLDGTMKASLGGIEDPL